jgi:SAM-dependent methyltransferase
MPVTPKQSRFAAYGHRRRRGKQADTIGADAHDRPEGSFSDAGLVERYKRNYGLSNQVSISPEQVRAHLTLERDLTRELLASDPEHRWAIFESCYGRLYESLPWLSGSGGTPDPERWRRLLAGSRTVYEVGSGPGYFARWLAATGFAVKATDIARTRGGTRPSSAALQWGVTDGVHLDRFEPPGSYDAVISDQLIEHLHPDDIGEHLQSSRRILRPGGRYVLRTPHALTGPHDVSKVFGFDRPVGMHLREYTNRELRSRLRAAGFSTVSAVITIPRTSFAAASRTYLWFVIGLEWLLARLPQSFRRKLASSLRGPLAPRVFLVAERRS